MRVLIVDDEPLARKRIARLLAESPDIEIAGECADGGEAVAQIVALKPDLVFLDVQMPEVGGFEVIEAIPPEELPVIIFATAYDSYAIRAFEANALDYLLKPFDDERFLRALDRARREFTAATESPAQKLAALLDSLKLGRGYLQRLAAKGRGKVVFLRTNEVDWIETYGNYVRLHAGKEKYLLRGTMNALEPKLNPDQFARIHRSTIVNLDRIKELGPWIGGEQVVFLRDGTSLTVGRAFRERLRRLLDNAVG